MNKSKKQKAFNISLTFGVLSLLFACIFASFFVDTPNVLAYQSDSAHISFISGNSYYNGAGFYNDLVVYDVAFNDTSKIAYFKYVYRFYSSTEFDSFLFSICNPQGALDYMFDYNVNSYSINIAISPDQDESWALDYPLNTMINFIRPDDEYQSFLSYYDAEDYGGYGTYLIYFDSSQEIIGEGNIAVYMVFQFSNITDVAWNSLKNIQYDLYKQIATIEVLNVGVIEPDGSYNDGYLVGYNQGKSLSNQAQYDAGYTAGVQAGGNIGSWLAGIGEAPLTLIKSLFNIEIFGINLNTIVFSLLGALVVIKLIRLFI